MTPEERGALVADKVRHAMYSFVVETKGGGVFPHDHGVYLPPEQYRDLEAWIKTLGMWLPPEITGEEEWEFVVGVHLWTNSELAHAGYENLRVKARSVILCPDAEGIEIRPLPETHDAP